MDRLTLTAGGADTPSSRSHAASCSRARRITHWPSSLIAPHRSASGMNALGGRCVPSGCGHRTSASTRRSLPSSRSMTGWSCSRSSLRSIARRSLAAPPSRFPDPGSAAAGIQRSPPSCLARYIAASARRSTSLTASPPAASDTPIEPWMLTGPCDSSNGQRSVRTRRSARSATSPSSLASTRTANSSPPSRATVSVARSIASSRALTATSNSSPAWCPSPSLTALNPSRSMNSSPSAAASRPARTRRASACSSRSTSSARLGRPVTGSWWARCSKVRASSSRTAATDTVPITSSSRVTTAST